MRNKIAILIVAVLTAASAAWGTVVFFPKASGGSTSEYILGTEWVSDGTSWGSSTVVRGNTFTTDSTGGTLTKLCVRIHTYNSSHPDVKVGIYATSSGAPTGNPLAQVTITTTSTGNICGSISGGPNLSATTDYYVGVLSSTGDTKYGYKSSTGENAYYKDSSAYSSEFTSPAGTYSHTADRLWAVWGVYEH